VDQTTHGKIVFSIRDIADDVQRDTYFKTMHNGAELSLVTRSSNV